MGLLSREIVRRVGPLVAAGAAGAAGAVIAQRRLMRSRRLALTSGRVGPDAAAEDRVPPTPPAPPQPPPDPVPVPTPEPAPPDPAPDPAPPAPTPAAAGAEAHVGLATAPAAGRDDALAEQVGAALADTGHGDAVDVSAEGAQVVLRGRVDTPEQIDELRRVATGVPGVEGVRVLLHLPGRVRRRPA
jgi:hypothetical protein